MPLILPLSECLSIHRFVFLVGGEDGVRVCSSAPEVSFLSRWPDWEFLNPRRPEELWKRLVISRPLPG